MPTYEYQCDSCGTRVEAFQWYSEPPLVECPSCPGSLNRLLGAGSCGIVKGSPTTIGQQAELNARRVGKEQLQMMADADKARVSEYTGPMPKGASPLATKAETPWFRNGSVAGVPALERPLDLSSVKDVKAYVEGK